METLTAIKFIDFVPEVPFYAVLLFKWLTNGKPLLIY